MRSIIVLAAASLASACSLMTPADPAKTSFDFGPLTSNPVLLRTVNRPFVVTEITAPAWLDNSSMYYRLVYRNADNPLPYRASGWVMPPAALLTRRLQAQLSPVTWEVDDRTAGESTQRYVLSGELLEFEQVFDAPGHSRGVLRLRAALEGGSWSAERTFSVEEPAPTPDARGGVVALVRCSNVLARDIAEWVATIGRESGGQPVAGSPLGH